MGGFGDKLKDIIGAAAPVLANAIVPGGGAVASMLASAFGVGESEDDIARAIQRDPDAAAKLKQIEQDHIRELRKINLEHAAKQHAEQHKTIRAELASDNFYKSGWRPTIGWVLALSLAAIMGTLAYAIFTQPDKAAEIMNAASGVLMFMAGLLGYNAKKRSDDKALAAGLAPKSVGEAIAGIFAKK